MAISNIEPKTAQQLSWEQRLMKNSTQKRSGPKPEYQELKFTLHRKLLDKINLEALATIDNQRVRGEVRQALITLIDGEPTLLSSVEKQQICDEVLDEVFGLGPLEPLLADPTISDILVNGSKQVYVERRGLLELTNVTFRDDQHLLRIIDKIVSQVGRRVDESNPMVDARLADGSRVNAIIPPLALDGPLMSIRRFSQDKLMPADLVSKKALTQGMMELLEAAVKAHMNIIIAGGTVAIGVLGLAIAQVPLVTRMGLCAALSVLVAVVAALTLLPAALGLVGTRLSGWRIPKITRPGPVQLEGADGKPHGWARWSLMVTRRPWPFLGGALAILIVLAIPLFSIDLGMVDSGSDPKSSTTYKAYGLVSKGFGPGSNGPIEVVLSGPNAQASAAAVAAAAKKVPDVAGTIGPIPSPTRPVSLITVVPQSAPASQATETLITQLESALQPVAGAGTQVYVTGTTAVGAELAAKVAARLPWFIGVVILISFILLMIEFRSLLVPLQAAIMNLLSVGAAFGVVVFVFQEGHGLSLIGVDQPVSIESWVPLMMFAILFGLSMDYEVFLLSRIREGWMATGDPHKSVALGLAGTARVISAAALVMVCVFLAFVLEPNVVVKMLGVGLATAVLVDATVVRLMLVPAVMILVGKGNWWLPKWLDRILPTLKEPGQG